MLRAFVFFILGLKVFLIKVNSGSLSLLTLNKNTETQDRKYVDKNRQYGIFKREINTKKEREYNEKVF